VMFFLSLLPYLNKAFHIDDAIFLWTAKHIQADPIRFYNFKVNWNGTEMPMWMRNQNPPLVSYYIAAASYLIGWSEFALHFALLVPALAIVAGTYFLAKELCSEPFLATVVGLMTPVFLVSCTTIMSDILMLCFWVWAVYLWMSGIKEHRFDKLLIASILIAASSLSKYFGASLIPLLFCYSIVQTKKIGAWLFPLLIPVSILILYEIATKAIYGQGLLSSAFLYPVTFREVFQSSVFARLGTLLSFMGGCFISAALFVPFLWRKKALALSLILPVAMMVLLPQIGSISSHKIISEKGVDWMFVITFALFTYSGMLLIATIVADLIKNMNADSLLIALWSIGTLAFAGLLNWSVNGRSILPLGPLLGILLVRRFDRRKMNIELYGSWSMLGVLIIAVVIGHMVALADYKFANTARQAAQMIAANHRGNTATLWFQGHWGFQYYMEPIGGKAIDFLSPSFAKGDIIVVPSNNTGGIIPIAQDMIEKIDEIRLSTNSYVTVMNSSQGAGFYSDVFGPLPYAIGPRLTVTYTVYRVL